MFEFCPQNMYVLLDLGTAVESLSASSFLSTAWHSPLFALLVTGTTVSVGSTEKNSHLYS
jgi:uncharacterized membrane protein YraQ (UPF0718 family)